MNETQEKEMPTWAQVRERINQWAAESGEWAGAPLPIDCLRLTVEPRYPWQGLNGLSNTNEDWKGRQRTDPPESEIKFRNSWHDSKTGEEIVIYEEAGRVGFCRMMDHAYANRWNFQFNTLGVAASEAWSVEAECRAIEKLRELTTKQAFKCYWLSGMFLETSKRSGLTYCFRKLRPTVAIRKAANGLAVPFAALCTHSIGYYQESHAGVMVPTDCVISHLLMMRGDEHEYWKRSNQHPLHFSNAGI